MKYTVLGFSQTKAVENNLDMTDLILLRYFIDFKDTGKMSTYIENEKMYYWFKYEGFLKEYPILSIKNDTVYRRMKLLVEKGFLIHTTLKKGGTYSYYNVSKNIICLLSDSIPQGYGLDSVGGTDSKPQQNNPSTKLNPSTKTILKKESEFDLLIKEYTTNEELKTNIYEFIKMRKTIKATMTTLGLKKMLNKLDTLASNDKDKIAILDNSIMNSWKGIFELKEDGNARGCNKQDTGEKQKYNFGCFE